MLEKERRQHFRIDDFIHFDYRIIETGGLCSDKTISEELLGQNGKRYLETIKYFQSVDQQLAELKQTLALKEPAINEYLNLINTKIDYLARHLTLGEKTLLRKVNLSLGGMAFKSKEKIEEKTYLKMVIYTKPKMIPIVVDAFVVYSQFINPKSYRTAVQFEGLDHEQEQLLSQHIMLNQVQNRSDYS